VTALGQSGHSETAILKQWLGYLNQLLSILV
jgi:hypothetical protein